MTPPAAIQVALNGARAPSAAPELPLLPPRLVKDMRDCAALGATSFHVHPRDEQGSESLEPAVVARWVRMLRQAAPGATISVSTGEWIAPLDARLRAIGAWRTRPDLASVNFHEAGAEAVADALLACGIGVEAGIWHAEAARRFLRYPRQAKCRRLMLELPDTPAPRALGVMADIMEVLGEDGRNRALVLHGEGRSAWAMVGVAIARRIETRIGLEDTLVLPDGTRACSNAVLFSAALRMSQMAGRERKAHRAR